MQTTYTDPTWLETLRTPAITLSAILPPVSTRAYGFSAISPPADAAIARLTLPRLTLVDNAEELMRTVSADFCVTLADVKSRSKLWSVVDARFTCAHLMRICLHLSDDTIAKLLGRCRSNIIHSRRALVRRMSVDRPLAIQVRALELEITARIHPQYPWE